MKNILSLKRLAAFAFSAALLVILCACSTELLPANAA